MRSLTFALLRDSSDLHIYKDLCGENNDCCCGASVASVAAVHNCCAASVASEQHYKQDLRKIYRRGDEFSN